MCISISLHPGKILNIQMWKLSRLIQCADNVRYRACNSSAERRKSDQACAIYYLEKTGHLYRLFFSLIKWNLPFLLLISTRNLKLYLKVNLLAYYLIFGSLSFQSCLTNQSISEIHFEIFLLLLSSNGWVIYVSASFVFIIFSLLDC